MHSSRIVNAFGLASATNRLDKGQRDELAALPFSIAMRAAAGFDLRAVRRALALAVESDLIDLPATRQAVALLRRATLLGRMSSLDDATPDGPVDVAGHTAMCGESGRRRARADQDGP
jgi:hypothetical protein